MAGTAQGKPISYQAPIVSLSIIVIAWVPPGGIQSSDKSGSPKVLKNAMQNWWQIKAENIFLASEAAESLGKKVIPARDVKNGWFFPSDTVQL